MTATLYRGRPITYEGVQWFRNGDHPADRVGKQEVDLVRLAELHPELLEVDDAVKLPDDAPTYERLEGAVVRFYRHPDVPGDSHCSTCGRIWHVHGWIDQGPEGLVVHPGNWVLTSDRETYLVVDRHFLELLFAVRSDDVVIDFEAGANSLESAMYQAVGRASMCWDKVENAGVFDDRKARRVGEDLIAYVNKLLDTAVHADRFPQRYVTGLSQGSDG